MVKLWLASQLPYILLSFSRSTIGNSLDIAAHGEALVGLAVAVHPQQDVLHRAADLVQEGHGVLALHAARHCQRLLATLLIQTVGCKTHVTSSNPTQPLFCGNESL